MDDFWWQTLWMATATVVIAYPSMLFIGSLGPRAPFEHAIIAFDQIAGETHTITGTIVVPSECHGLEAKVLETSASTTHHIAFSTWQEPYRDCPRASALKRFRIITFAPAKTAFTASLDGDPVDIQVIEHRVQ